MVSRDPVSGRYYISSLKYGKPIYSEMKRWTVDLKTKKVEKNLRRY